MSGADKVLMGATSTTGSSAPGQGDVPPIEFVQGLTCVDQNPNPLNTPACAGYQPLQADGYAHHPSPWTRARALDVPLADTSRLEALLTRLYQQGRITSNLPIYDTEYGYDTNPPDPYAPFTPAQRARFVGWSTYLACSDPRTVMFSRLGLEPGAAAAPELRHGRRVRHQSGRLLTTTAPLLASTATYRLAWLDPSGNWEYGVPIPVDSTHPLPLLGASPQLQPLSAGLSVRQP